MKKQSTFFLLIVLAGSLLSSCGNLSKISFTKRHYRSGYYVDFGLKKNTSATAQSAAQPMRTKHKVPAFIETKQPDPLIVIVSKTSDGITTASRKNVKPETVKYTGTIPVISKSSFVVGQSTSDNRNNESEGDVHARVDINIPYVVIILCAIFIPPLGVGLMYGLNSYFWIDLILTLLFFIPGMIFALIVVLM